MFSSLHFLGCKGTTLQGGMGFHKLVWVCSWGVPLNNGYEWRDQGPLASGTEENDRFSKRPISEELRYLLSTSSLSE